MILRRLAAGVALLAALTASAQKPRTVTVQLLAINDLHGNLEPPSGTDGLVNQIPAGGVEYLATHLHNASLENPNSIVIAAGDLMGASPLLSNLFHDSPTIEAMNALNMSVSSIGNHELDHGSSELLARIKGGCLEKQGCKMDEISAPVKFQYLAANVLTESGKALLPATAVRTVGGVKIGFIGETLQGMVSMIGPAAARGLRFLEESNAANAAAAQLERQGVHTIVLLVHQGGRQVIDSSQTRQPVDPNGCANFSGAIVEIAKKLSPSIKVLISAHTHSFYNCEIDGHLVTSAGSFGRLFTRVNLSIDASTDRLLDASAKNEVVTRDVPKDAAMTAILDKYRPGAARLADRSVGSIAQAMTRSANPVGESSLGDVVADADLEASRGIEGGGAVIAFQNSGGIRANLTGRSGPNGPRTISYADIYAVQPFGNRLTVISMTGAMIRRLLEEQFAGGRFNILQVSDGFSYQYRRNAPEGEHVVAGSTTLHGRPIGMAETVRVEVLDFLISGGSGFNVFTEGTNAVTGGFDVDALVDYFAKHSPVAPGPQSRVVRTD
jgi:5'-nucleotidase